LIDSSGVGAIVSLFKRVKADGGKVVVVRAHDQPLAVLKLLKLDKVFGL
jgi:anti-sigma B factor antagonist